MRGTHEATREGILEEASRLFREHGIAAVGLTKVVTEHFESKEALVREALLRSLDGRHEGARAGAPGR
jgi:AcrR family transcriptional regulator